MSTLPGQRTPRAFTLLELLVTVAVVGILSSLLYSATKNFVNLSNTTKCMSNLRGLGQVAMLYVADHENYMPPARVEPVGYWQDHLHEYVDRKPGRDGRFEGADAWKSPWRCPSLKPGSRVGYTINIACGYSEDSNKPAYVKLGRSQVGNTIAELPGTLAQTAWFADMLYFSDYLRPSNFRAERQFLDWRHNKAANVLFMDGHVETVKYPGFKEDSDLIRREKWVKFFGGYQ